MNMNFGKAGVFFKNKQLLKKVTIYRLGENPNYDWVALIVCFLLVSFSTAGYVFYSLNSLSESLNSDFLSQAVTDKSRVFDEQKLKEVTDFYEARKVFQVSGEPLSLVDPSL